MKLGDTHNIFGWGCAVRNWKPLPYFRPKWDHVYFSPLSVDSQPTVDRLSTDSRSMGRPTAGPYLFTDGRPWQSVVRMTVGRQSADCMVMRVTVESWCWQEKELTVSCTSCEDERNALCATSRSRTFQWGIWKGFDPNPVSGVWVSSTTKARTCFILEMVLKDCWRNPLAAMHDGSGSARPWRISLLLSIHFLCELDSKVCSFILYSLFFLSWKLQWQSSATILRDTWTSAVYSASISVVLQNRIHARLRSQNRSV